MPKKNPSAALVQSRVPQRTQREHFDDDDSNVEQSSDNSDNSSDDTTSTSTTTTTTSSRSTSASHNVTQEAPSSSVKLIDRKNFEQGNTWLICQNNDVLFENGYDGPLAAGMVVMYQEKSRTAFRTGHSYGVDRYFYKIEKLDEEGNIQGKILETDEITQDSDDESDAVSEEDEIVNIKNVKGKLNAGDVLQVEYTLSGKGVMHSYTRINRDPTLVPRLFTFDRRGNANDS